MERNLRKKNFIFRGYLAIFEGIFGPRDQKGGKSKGVRMGRFVYYLEEEMKLPRDTGVIGLMRDGCTQGNMNKNW